MSLKAKGQGALLVPAPVADSAREDYLREKTSYQGARNLPRPAPITENLLKEIVQKAVKGFRPQKIILFGSRARADSRQDSDLDLLVIMPTRLRPIQRAVRFREVCRPKFVAMDVLVRTPGEIAKRLQMRDPFYMDILEHGRVLYEA